VTRIILSAGLAVFACWGQSFEVASIKPAPDERTVPPSDGQGGPTLNAALHQLGLRLEQKKASVDILFIDHVEKVPTEN